MPKKRQAPQLRGATRTLRHNQGEFRQKRWLANLGVEQLRVELVTLRKDLKEEFPSKRRSFLWLPEGDRRTIRSHIGRTLPPDDARFWRYVAKAVVTGVNDRRAMLDAIDRSPLPTEWVEPAKALLGALDAIRKGAQRVLAEWVGSYRTRWDQGDEGGLTDLVQDDAVNASWVQEAINELRRVRVKGASDEQKHAAKLLRNVGTALGKVGGGRSERLTDDERAEQKRKKNRGASIATRARRLVQAHGKEMSRRARDQRIGPSEVADRLVADFKRGHRSLDRATLNAVEENFRQRLLRGVSRKKPEHS